MIFFQIGSALFAVQQHTAIKYIGFIAKIVCPLDIIQTKIFSKSVIVDLVKVIVEWLLIMADDLHMLSNLQMSMVINVLEILYVF